MKSLLAKIGAAFGAHYDKLLAALGLGILLWAAVAYLLGAGVLKTEEREWQRDLAQLAPEHPEAPLPDLAHYDRQLADLDAPAAPRDSDVMLAVPPVRYTCMFCENPKPLEQEEPWRCPFCGETEEKKKGPPPPPTVADADNDGLLDEWELAHGMSKDNALDANQDLDADGFTSREEYQADPQTHPKDFASHPPLTPRFKIARLVKKPFRFQFKSMIMGPDGRPKLLFNDSVTKETLVVQTNETVGPYRIKNFEKKTEVQKRFGAEVEVDVSEVTLQSMKDPSKEVTLVRDAPGGHFDAGVLLEFTLDRSTYPVWEGGDFALKGELHKGRAFTVKEIDSKKRRVLIRDAKTGHESWLSAGEGM